MFHTHWNNRYNYSFVYFNIEVLTEETGGQNILIRMVASIPRI